jgi:hypothetical protein
MCFGSKAVRPMKSGNHSLFVDYRVQLESLPSVYGQLSHTPKSLKRLQLKQFSLEF